MEENIPLSSSHFERDWTQNRKDDGNLKIVTLTKGKGVQKYLQKVDGPVGKGFVFSARSFSDLP